MPRLTGIGVVVVLAGGGLGLVYAHSAHQKPPRHVMSSAVHGPALSARVVRQRTVGLIDFGPYDDRDAWVNDPDDHPLMLRRTPAGIEFVQIPPSELTSGLPQWTADTMADGSEVFIYIPTGQCLSAGHRGLVLARCALRLGQRWRAVHRTTAAGEAFSAFASARSGRCLTAPGRPGPAYLARCGPARTKDQEIAFWWSP